MTHATATARNTIGIPPSACTGELQVVTTGTDTEIPRGGADSITITVTVYQCSECRERLSIATGPDGAQWLRNSYHDPKGMVQDLAQTFRIGE